MNEFAERAEKQGKRVIDAAIEAARIRLRPILMTSFAFIFGVMPLAISTGAGANSRIAIGTSVIGGMLTATILAIFYIPLFFVLVRRSARDGIARLRARIAPPAGGAKREARRRPDRACSRPRARRWSRRYVRPSPAIPSSWPVGDPYLRAAEAPLPAVRYTDIFRDPRLQTLIAQALVNNRDLMVAAANIAAAREQYRIQRASQFPTLDANAGATVSGGDEGARSNGQQSARRQSGRESSRLQPGLSVPSFELDLFGRLRSLTHASSSTISRPRPARARPG